MARVSHSLELSERSEHSTETTHVSPNEGGPHSNSNSNNAPSAARAHERKRVGQRACADDARVRRSLFHRGLGKVPCASRTPNSWTQSVAMVAAHRAQGAHLIGKLRARVAQKSSRPETFANALPATKSEPSGGTRLAGKATRAPESCNGLRASQFERLRAVKACQQGTLDRTPPTRLARKPVLRKSISRAFPAKRLCCDSMTAPCWEGAFNAIEPRRLAGKELSPRSNRGGLPARPSTTERRGVPCGQGSLL